MKRKIRMRRLAPLLALLMFGFAVSAALAHPLGNFTINHYARVEPAQDQIRVRYVLDYAEIPAFQAKQDMDTDGNGATSDQEKAVFLNGLVPAVIANLTLGVNGQPVPLAAESGTPTLEFLPGQGGLEVMRVTMWLRAPFQVAQNSTGIQFSDQNFPERLGWREIVVRAGNGAAVENSNVSATDASNELTSYPESLLTNPMNVREASFTVVPGAVTSTATQPAGAVNPVATGALGAFDRTREAFGKLLTDNQDWSPVALAIAFLAAMALGALHSFSPGHGKAVVGSYLVGSRGNWQHAVFLGLIVTTTHTAGVYALGFVTLFLSAYILPEQLFPWLGFISGMMVALIGVRLLVSRWRAAKSQTTAYDKAMRGNGSTNSNPLGHAFGHAPQPELAHAHADGVMHAHAYAAMPARVAMPSHSHSHEFATPEEEEAHAREHLAEIQAMEKPSWKNLLSLGISGGLLPCPSALVVMLSAIALGRVLYGLFLIVGFSLGLAGVLVLTGLALLYAGRFAGKLLGGKKMGVFMRFMPIVGALVVAVLGVGIAIEALTQTSFLP